MASLFTIILQIILQTTSSRVNTEKFIYTLGKVKFQIVLADLKFDLYFVVSEIFPVLEAELQKQKLHIYRSFSRFIQLALLWCLFI